MRQRVELLVDRASLWFLHATPFMPAAIVGLLWGVAVEGPVNIDISGDWFSDAFGAAIGFGLVTGWALFERSRDQRKRRSDIGALLDAAHSAFDIALRHSNSSPLDYQAAIETVDEAVRLLVADRHLDKVDDIGALVALDGIKSSWPIDFKNWKALAPGTGLTADTTRIFATRLYAAGVQRLDLVRAEMRLHRRRGL